MSKVLSRFSATCQPRRSDRECRPCSWIGQPVSPTLEVLTPSSSRSSTAIVDGGSPAFGGVHGVVACFAHSVSLSSETGIPIDCRYPHSPPGHTMVLVSRFGQFPLKQS